MGIYEHLGMRKVINLAGPLTCYGGALLKEETLKAMDEAAKASVRLEEAQAIASKIIAEKTHAEAGIVTCGACAALTLATAACLTGFNIAAMNRLPDSTGLRNEVIKPWHQISGYDHSIWVAGAKIVAVGVPNGPIPPNEVHIISRWDVESAITENTAAIAYTAWPDNHPPLEEVIEIGKRYHIPIIVDAAAQVPPVQNLYRFIDMGADLVCFSGGKGIRGPQASGILCGRRDLIASAAMQGLDMGSYLSFEQWNPPMALIPKDKLCGKPEHGIGRGMKVTKEAIVGLLVALQNLTEEGFAEEARHLRELLHRIEERIKDIAGLQMRITQFGEGGYPMLEVKIDEQVTGRSAMEVHRRLEDDGIYVRDWDVHKGFLVVHSGNMNGEIAQIFSERLRAAITDRNGVEECLQSK